MINVRRSLMIEKARMNRRLEIKINMAYEAIGKIMFGMIEMDKRGVEVANNNVVTLNAINKELKRLKGLKKEGVANYGE